MFGALSDSKIDDIIESVCDYQHSKIDVYDPIYKCIHDFVDKHKLIHSDIGGECKFSFKIYGSYIFQYANALANELAEFTPYIRLNTDERNKEFSIVVDCTIVIKMHNIDPNFMKIMESSMTSKGVLSPEIELIDIYHKLYSPDMYASWDQIILREKKMWKEFSAIRDSIIQNPTVTGGSNEHVDIVLDWLKNQSGYVIVGDVGARLLIPGVDHYTNAVQFIASNPKAMISSLREYMKEFLGGSINVKKYDMNMPDDNRIRKFVISATVKNNTFYIANVFNSASYELIQFRCVDKLNVGVPVVLLRFMFADVWFFRVLRFFGMMDQSTYKKNMLGMYANIDKIHSMWVNENKKDVHEFPMYIGTYISEIISKKENISVFPYYPAKYKLENGDFRKIGNIK